MFGVCHRWGAMVVGSIPTIFIAVQFRFLGFASMQICLFSPPNEATMSKTKKVTVTLPGSGKVWPGRLTFHPSRVRGKFILDIHSVPKGRWARSIVVDGRVMMLLGARQTVTFADGIAITPA